MEIIIEIRPQNTSIKATGNKRGLVSIFAGCASALLFSLDRNKLDKMK